MALKEWHLWLVLEVLMSQQTPPSVAWLQSKLLAPSLHLRWLPIPQLPFETFPSGSLQDKSIGKMEMEGKVTSHSCKSFSLIFLLRSALYRLRDSRNLIVCLLSHIYTASHPMSSWINTAPQLPFLPSPTTLHCSASSYTCLQLPQPSPQLHFIALAHQPACKPPRTFDFLLISPLTDFVVWKLAGSYKSQSCEILA